MVNALYAVSPILLCSVQAFVNRVQEFTCRHGVPGRHGAYANAQRHALTLDMETVGCMVKRWLSGDVTA
jgi:hypothetical protein